MEKKCKFKKDPVVPGLKDPVVPGLKDPVVPGLNGDVVLQRPHLNPEPLGLCLQLHIV